MALVNTLHVPQILLQNSKLPCNPKLFLKMFTMHFVLLETLECAYHHFETLAHSNKFK